jgi:hypothetical protein
MAVRGAGAAAGGTGDQLPKKTCKPLTLTVQEFARY